MIEILCKKDQIIYKWSSLSMEEDCNPNEGETNSFRL
jgi:hypothetical protein